ncbi:tetratricopeptide repeat protein 38-like [Saccoglossus kowalevskii]
MSWKDCKEWENIGLPLSTTSNEAAKMYDAIVTQYMSGFSDDSVDGIGGAIKKMTDADPNFVMGPIISNGLTLFSMATSTWNNPELKSNIEKMVQSADNDTLTWREKLHIKAIKLFSEGDFTGASDTFEEILLQHPTDALAFRFALDCYFYRGEMAQYRDCAARVMPYWKSGKVSQSMYGYLKSLYAFGLEETNFFDEAEKESLQSLELNSRDGWATHTIAHVMEMQCRYDEGIRYLNDTAHNGQKHFFEGHIYWHLGLYYIEKGDYEAALSLYDEYVGSKVDSGVMLDISDAASFLQRLEYEGVNVGPRWMKVFNFSKTHVDDQALVFNDLHFMMAALGAKQQRIANELFESIRNFVRSSSSDHTVAKTFEEVGIPICESLNAYHCGDFAKVVNTYNPVRYNTRQITGSDAQRDVFNLLLIHSALKSPEMDHKLLARSLLYERDAFKPGSPMTARLLEKATAESPE